MRFMFILPAVVRGRKASPAPRTKTRDPARLSPDLYQVKHRHPHERLSVDLGPLPAPQDEGRAAQGTSPPTLPHGLSPESTTVLHKDHEG